MEPQAQPTASSARRAGPGRARPGALGGRKLGLRAPTQQAATARSEGRCATGAGAALTVVFVSAARSGRGRTQRRLRGSYHPHARSCAPRRTRRFLALAPRPGSGEGRAEGGARGGRAPRPRVGRAAGPAPCPRPRPSPLPRLPLAWTPLRPPRRAAPSSCADWESPAEASRGPGAGTAARAGRDAREDGDEGWVGARGAPPHPRGLGRLARRGGACARSGPLDSPGRARLLLSLHASVRSVGGS